MTDKKFRSQVTFKSDYVLIELEGMLSGDFILEISKQVQKSEEYKPGTSEIWDISSADLSEVDSDSLFKASEDLEATWQGFQKSKIAVVSQKSINIGHIYLFSELYQRDTVRAFESLKEAKKWFAEP